MINLPVRKEGRSLLSLILMAALLVPFSRTYTKPRVPRPELFLATASIDDEAWLGIWLGRVTPTLRKRYHLRTKEGVFVVDVVDDSPADKAGIRKHDVILSFDGEKVPEPADLTTLLQEYEPGDTVQIVFERRGRRKTVKAVLSRKPENPFGRLFPLVPRVLFLSEPAARLGVELQELNPDLARYFKLKRAEGALITSVKPGSIADNAGLKAGDVIVEIDGQSVDTPDEVNDLLRDAEPGDVIEITVIRDGRRKSLELKLPVNRWQGHFYVAPKGLPGTVRKQLERLQRYNMDTIERLQRQEVREKLEKEVKELRKQVRELQRQVERMQREFEKLKKSR